MVPQLVICHKCRITLYEGEELKNLGDIIQEYDGRCPSCRKRLSYVPKNIEVRSIEVPNRLNPFEPVKEKSSRTKSRLRTKKHARERRVYVGSRPISGGIWGTE